MKLIVICLCFLSTTSTLLTKVSIIHCSKRFNQTNKSHDKEEIKAMLHSTTPVTMLVESHNVEQSIELLYYAQHLHKYNNTIVCKVPEEIDALMSWCPYINKVVSSEDTINYDIKVDFEELISLVPITKNKTAEPTSLINIDETLLAIWHAAFITNSNFKIGVYCSELHATCLPENNPLTIHSFFPLGLLQYTSLYTFDDLTNYKVPDMIQIFQFDKSAKQSLVHTAAIMYHMHIIITTQPIIAYLAEALGKQTWLIVPTQTNTETLAALHPNIRILQQSTKEELIHTILHDLAHIITKPQTQIVSAEVAIGELIDKITILEIKTERIQDQDKLKNIYTELESLQQTLDTCIDMTPELEHIIMQLKKANEALWVTEDLIRDKERAKCFDDEFITLARAIYIQNDERCKFKRNINELLGSRLHEEKSYKPYN